MSLVTRLLQQFDTTGVPVYLPQQGKIQTTTSKDTTSGTDLLHCIEEAKEQIRKLEFTVQEMTRVVEGLTAEEAGEQKAREDADPEPYARAAKWMLLPEMKEHLTARGEALAGWIGYISTIPGAGATKIVRLKDRGLPDNKYPMRHQYVWDYFEEAESWALALTQVRREAALAYTAKRKEGLGW
jgi:hypothetical protein